MDKRVYVCSPLKPYTDGAGVEHTLKDNLRAALLYCRIVMERGDIPVCPHLWYISAGLLKDEISEERARGMAMGLAELRSCDVLEAFGVHLSDGMLQELLEAARVGKCCRLPAEILHRYSEIAASFNPYLKA